MPVVDSWPLFGLYADFFAMSLDCDGGTNILWIYHHQVIMVLMSLFWTLLHATWTTIFRSASQTTKILLNENMKMHACDYLLELMNACLCMKGLLLFSVKSSLWWAGSISSWNDLCCKLQKHQKVKSPQYFAGEGVQGCLK